MEDKIIVRRGSLSNFIRAVLPVSAVYINSKNGQLVRRKHGSRVFSAAVSDARTILDFVVVGLLDEGSFMPSAPSEPLRCLTVYAIQTSMLSNSPSRPHCLPSAPFDAVYSGLCPCDEPSELMKGKRASAIIMSMHGLRASIVQSVQGENTIQSLAK